MNKKESRLFGEKFNKTIDEAIAHLAAEEFDQAAEAMEEIAHIMKSAGVNRRGFMDMVGHVGSSAAREHPSPEFLDEKFRVALQDRAKKRGKITNLRIVTP